MALTGAETVDLTDPTLYGAGVPHHVFAELRRAGAVHRHQGRDLTRDRPVEFWSVVGHPEVQAANRDWHTYTASLGSGLVPLEPERRGHMIVSTDPPDHTRLRKLISAGFTPRMITRLEEHIAERAARILTEVGARGECDFVTEVAYQLPMHVIADIMGIPESDRRWVFERTETLLVAMDPTSELGDADRRQAEIELFGYAQQLGGARRADRGDDIWSILANAEVHGDDGQPTSLSELELDLFFLVLTLAGSETTRNAISQGLVALLDHPDQLQALRADRSLVPSAAEEMIRWASPVLYFGRTATVDCELGGQRIAAGDRVVLWYPSANRDERAFEAPDRFDIRRSPNPHVAFGGGGPHYCLGANLARKEVQVLTGALLDRFDGIELTGEPVWSGGGAVNNVGVSLRHLPVRLRPR